MNLTLNELLEHFGNDTLLVHVSFPSGEELESQLCDIEDDSVLNSRVIDWNFYGCTLFVSIK